MLVHLHHDVGVDTRLDERCSGRNIGGGHPRCVEDVELELTRGVYVYLEHAVLLYQSGDAGQVMFHHTVYSHLIEVVELFGVS